MPMLRCTICGSVMCNTRPKILVVDDEGGIRLTLAVIFAMHGYETATAFSGEEAVQVACSFHLDCIVSDVMMGGDERHRGGNRDFARAARVQGIVHDW
jgi:CheY-like chemotaxis protein